MQVSGKHRGQKISQIERSLSDFCPMGKTCFEYQICYSIRKETNCFNQNVTMGSSFYNFWHFATYQFLGYFFKRSKIPNKSIQTKLIFHIILYKERRTKIEVCNNCPLDRRKWRKWRKVLHFECVWLCNDKNEATYFSVTSVLNTRVNRK